MMPGGESNADAFLRQFKCSRSAARNDSAFHLPPHFDIIPTLPAPSGASCEQWRIRPGLRGRRRNSCCCPRIAPPFSRYAAWPVASTRKRREAPLFRSSSTAHRVAERATSATPCTSESPASAMSSGTTPPSGRRSKKSAWRQPRTAARGRTGPHRSRPRWPPRPGRETPRVGRPRSGSRDRGS